MSQSLLDTREAEVFIRFFSHFYEQRKYTQTRRYEGFYLAKMTERVLKYYIKSWESLTEQDQRVLFLSQEL